MEEQRAELPNSKTKNGGKDVSIFFLLQLIYVHFLLLRPFSRAASILIS